MKPTKSKQKRVFDRLFLARAVIAIYIIYKLFDLKDPPLSFDNSYIALFGFIICMAGFILRSWTAGILEKNKQLVTWGPYSLWRHPLYTGSLLIAIGFCIILNDWFLWVVLSFFFLYIYKKQIKLEEDKLHRMFGEKWKVFKETSNLFFPKKIVVNKILAPWSFKLWIRNREYNSLIAITIALIVIEIWEIYFR